MRKSNVFILSFILGALLIVVSSCSDLLDTELEGTQLTQEEAIQSKDDILRVLQSCYDVNANFHNGRIQNLGELLGDNLEMQTQSGDYGQVYNHNVSVFNGSLDAIYTEPYLAVFRINQILNFIEDFDFDETEKARVIAEAKFLRAISHWEVVKLWAQPYGFTPTNSHLGIVYKTSVEVEILPRLSVAETYANVEQDLIEALNSQALLASSDYYASTDAANAYLAKFYFQKGDYTKAAQYASSVINTGSYSLGTSVDRFLPDTSVSPEVVFRTRSYSPTNDLRNGDFTANYGINNSPNPEFRATKELYDTYVTDTNDARVQQFLELLNPGTPEEFVAIRKFNRQIFDVAILHLTDLKLLRAEALALSGTDLATAIQDVNDVRERAYGSANRNLGASASASAIIDAARYERRIEMLGEGDRIQQLKRRGALEGEAIEIRGDDWNCPGMIIQFPATERTSLFELNPQGGC
jgi:hypothetical protein